MKAHRSLLAVLSALALSVPLLAQPQPAPPVTESATMPPARPDTLHIVISAPLGGPNGGYHLYERVAGDYEMVFRQRKWPLKITSEEFGGGPGGRHHRLELEVFVQRLRQLVPGELTYSAWTTLIVDGRKQDLGVIPYVYHFHAFEDQDLVLDNTVKGGARVTAEKIEPLLFPRNP